MKRLQLLAPAVLLTLLCLATTASAAVINVPADYTTIAAAIAAASPGDQILIADNTYAITTTLNVNKSLTITGNSEGGVILQDSAGTGYGLWVHADNVTLENFTIDVTTSGAEGGYPIHASGTDNLPGGYTGLTISHLTVKGDVTTTPKRRTGIDVHGYTNVVLEYITSQDASWGNGLQLTGCINVTMDHITTLNNAWGSVAIYCSSTSYLSRGSDNVVIDGATCSFGEDYVFRQDEFGFFSTNVSVTGWGYHVYNDTFRPDAAGYTFFKDTEANAIASALAFTGYESGSSVERIADGHYVVGAGMTIQTAVDDAPVAGTVEVQAGTFEEQVEIAKDLNLLGAGMGVSTIASPASLPLSFTTTAANRPIVYVHDADNVAIHDFTVDGQGRGNANARFIGIAYREAGGGVYDCEIKDVRNNPLDGSQHGNAFYLYNDDAVARTIDVQGCDVYGFQKNGITVNETGSTPIVVDISGNTVTGAAGLTYDNGDPAQNGIQVYGDVLTGAVNNNTIHSIAYDNTNNPTKYVATSILDYFSHANVTNNVIDGTHVGVYGYGSQGTFSGNDLSIVKIGVSAYGIIATDPPAAVASPFDLPGEISAKAQSSAKMATLGVIIDGNTIAFSGGDNTATYGIDAESGYTADDLDLLVTNNTVTGFEAGVDVYQCESSCDTGAFISVAINDNSFSGNTYGVRSNLTSITVDGTCNWWGDVSGPAATSPLNTGTGDAVEGDVTYWPWLDSDITGTPSCSVYPNMFAAEPPAGVEITPCAPCLTVPIVLHRGDSTPIRGFSITFELSSELELCGSEIVPTYGAGSWVDGFSSGDVQDFVLNNGDGTYTVDRSILGAACGSTLDGTAFTVDVASALGSSSGTGTITVLSVIVRDCANAPVPAGSAGSATIDIDATAPDAVTSLSAAQVKTGNDADGTTKIHLAWTGPTDPDAATITLYRKGFGHYPEYDDDGGAVPSTPADPTAALGDGWAVAATLAASTTSYDDEPATRDFWYYVAFVDDGCNVSPVSNQTGGTLNYHLGDVSDGVTPGDGDNSVATPDISALGGGYGTSDGDINYKNWLDVGPTTDYSVDALPTTDNQIQFEDLMMFAINYGLVGKGTPTLEPAAFNEITLKTVPFGKDGVSVEIHMAGDGTLQGVHVPLQWNKSALQPVAMHEGSLMAKQGRTALVLAAKPGEVDAAVFGKGSGISGEALLAVIDFQRIGEGEPGIGPGEIIARDASNQEQSINGTLVSGAADTALPSRTVLHANYPNPFNPKTTLSFTLAKAGHVVLRIYTIGGREVATLASGDMAAGPHEIQWTGKDDHGRSVSSGTYLVRLVAPDVTSSQRITLLK